MIQTLVTGGTGFVGSAIVRHLIRGRESVRVLTRSPLTVDPRRRVAGTEYVQGNIFNEENVLAAMKGCDALIIASQFDNAPFENRSRGLTYEKVDGEGTERLVAAAKKGGIQRIIYISGAGTRDGRTESWFRAKWRAESAVQGSGTNWTIFRPSWIYGPTDKSLNKFRMFARLGPVVPVVGTGKEKIQPVYLEDVARSVHLSLNNPKAFGKIFEIGGPEEMMMVDIVKTMLRVLGKHRLILPQPKAVMKILASTLLRFAPAPFRLTPGGVDFVTMEEHVDTTLLKEILGVRLTPLEEGLRAYMVDQLPTSADQLRRHAA